MRMIFQSFQNVTFSSNVSFWEKLKTVFEN